MKILKSTTILLLLLVSMQLLSAQTFVVEILQGTTVCQPGQECELTEGIPVRIQLRNTGTEKVYKAKNVEVIVNLGMNPRSIFKGKTNWDKTNQVCYMDLDGSWTNDNPGTVTFVMNDIFQFQDGKKKRCQIGLQQRSIKVKFS